MLNTTTSGGTPSISAMGLRSSPGTILDLVDYRNESFIIERAGKPKAALVPLFVFENIQKAKQDLFLTNSKIRQAFVKENPKSVGKQIAKAIKEVRGANSRS